MALRAGSVTRVGHPPPSLHPRDAGRAEGPEPGEVVDGGGVVESGVDVVQGGLVPVEAGTQSAAGWCSWSHPLLACVAEGPEPLGVGRRRHGVTPEVCLCHARGQYQPATATDDLFGCHGVSWLGLGSREGRKVRNPWSRLFEVEPETQLVTAGRTQASA